MSHVARWIDLGASSDDRGRLRVVERGSSLPFVPLRMFIVDDVPSGDIRGDHAHRTCHQLLICTVGRVIVTAQPAEGSALEFDLTPNTGAVHIPPLVWATQRYEEHESQLVVLASEPYSPTEYIRDPEEFKALTGADLDLSDAVPVRS